MTFRSGMKVVCVDDDGQACSSGDRPVRLGAIYTVRDAFDFFGEPAVRLEEIMNPRDRAYHAYRFRPIVSRKTDISCFTVLLNPSKERENV